MPLYPRVSDRGNGTAEVPEGQFFAEKNGAEVILGWKFGEKCV